MREIKFRAWSEQDGMDYIEDFYWFEEEGVHDGGGRGHNRKYELMQFTGLLDVDGKEVYEGDILQDTLLKNQLCIVRWHVAGFSLFDLKGNFKWGSPGAHQTVVGNIYENPDLIKPEVVW